MVDSYNFSFNYKKERHQHQCGIILYYLLGLLKELYLNSMLKHSIKACHWWL